MHEQVKRIVEPVEKRKADDNCDFCPECVRLKSLCNQGEINIISRLRNFECLHCSVIWATEAEALEATKNEKCSWAANGRHEPERNDDMYEVCRGVDCGHVWSPMSSVACP